MTNATWNKDNATPTGHHAKTNMKSNVKTLALALSGLLVGSAQSQAQILLKVDSTRPWNGYMNVFNLPDYSGGYQFGSGWGVADLQAVFGGTTNLTLTPATTAGPHGWNTTDPAWETTPGASDNYWVNTNTVPATGNKFMEANFFVENTALRGTTVTFSGTVLSNNLIGGASGHLTRAYVKVLNSSAGYTLVPGAYEFVDLTNNASSYPFSITVTVPSGANMIPQYGFVTTGPNVNPATLASLGKVVIAVDNSDPAISSQPASQRVQVGGTATFTVTATGGSALSYQWKRYSTNLVNGGNISGASSATLTIINAQLSDETIYTCTVTNTAGSLDSDPAILRVKTAAEFANYLDDPGFEDPLLNPVTLIPKPWITFAGAGIRSTNDLYAFFPGYPIQTIDGTNAAYAYNAGEWNGAFQDVLVAPGEIMTADASFYISSLEQIFGDMTAWLEVQFRAGSGLINVYRSGNISSTSPMDTWLTLSATNGYANDFVTPIGNARYLVAPPGTTHVRYQVTVRAVGAASGDINFDGMKLMKKIPVTLSSSLGGGNITLSWPSQGATSYQVVYKNNVTDSTWTPLEIVAGTGAVLSRSYAISEDSRIYSVLTL